MIGKLLHSLKWSSLGELSSKILPPIFYIITARLLTPDDFGIVATSAMVIAFASILWEAGLSKALIQNQKYDIQQMSNIVFYTNIVLSVFLYFILLLLSDFIAYFFHDERIIDVLKISGLALIIGPLMSVQIALLQKKFEFKKLFYSRFVGTVIPGVVSVAMAWLGYGYWSLVFGGVASLLLQVLIIWYLISWRPDFSYDWLIAKDMFNFSKWILLSAILSWFFVWGDIFILGFFFTSHELGLYRTGNYFVGTVIGLITAPIVPVMYSYFSTIHHDIEKIKEVLLVSSKIISFFVLPIGVGLYIFQSPVSDLIFGKKWYGIASVIGYLALMHSVSWIIGLNNSAYAAVGRPDIETKILIFNLFLYLMAYILSAQVSFEFFLFIRFVLAAVSIFIHIYASKKILNIGVSETFLNIKYILSILLFIFIAYVLFFNEVIFSIFGMFLSLLVLMVLYILFIYYMDKNLFFVMKNSFGLERNND